MRTIIHLIIYKAPQFQSRKRNKNT